MVVVIKPSISVCFECGGNIRSTPERGETVCEGCGLIVGERQIDITHSGIRAFTKFEKNKKERTGSPMSILVPDISLNTIINRRNIKNADLKRASRWNSYMIWEKKNLLLAITELKRIATNLHLTDHVKKTAVKFYKEIFKKNLLRGRSIKGMIAACTYLSCKSEKAPITFQEVLSEASVNANIVKKCYKTLINSLNIRSSSMNPLSLIPRYINELGLDLEIEKAATKILSGYSKNPALCGKDPKGICAGTIYLVAKLKNRKISQKEIAKVVGITEVTLRSRYKELLELISFPF